MFKFIKTAKLQIAVFVLAIGGAFATNAMSGSATTLVDGYQRIDSDGFECSEPLWVCDTTPGEPCTYEVNGIAEEMYGLHYDTNLQAIVCSLPLSKVQP